MKVCEGVEVDIQSFLTCAVAASWPAARHPFVCCSVSQPTGRGPVPGPGINYTGQRETRRNYNVLQDFISPIDN